MRCLVSCTSPKSTAQSFCERALPLRDMHHSLPIKHTKTKKGIAAVLSRTIISVSISVLKPMNNKTCHNAQVRNVPSAVENADKNHRRCFAPRDEPYTYQGTEGGSILSQHLAIISKLEVLTRLVNLHAIGLRCDICHAVALLGFVEHGALSLISEVVATFTVRMRVKVNAKARDADTAEDAEDVALVFVEFRWGVAAVNEEVLAEECLNAGQAEVGEARAVV